MIDKNLLKIINESHINLINEFLMKACEIGHLELIKFTLESPELKVKADINYLYYAGFGIVCSSGNLDCIEYILNHPTNKLSTKVDYLNSGLGQACKNKDLKVINYLLHSDKLSNHANLDKLLTSSCRHGELEIVKYITTEPQLKAELDINKKIKKYFENALNYVQLDIIKYFIFEFNIPHKKVNALLNKYQATQAIEWFEKRDLHISLTNDLSINKQVQKRKKI